MSTPTTPDSLDTLSIEELQKLKLREEIMALKKPFWKQLQFISIVATMVIAFTGTSITIWQIQGNRVERAQAEQKKYQDMTKALLAEKDILNEKTTEANIRLREALSEKAAVVSEKTEIKNQVNTLQEMQLRQREKDLSERIARLRNINAELERVSKNYKEAFIETFVSKNATVQGDIERFAKEGMKPQMEIWLKQQFLFTALNRYQKFLVERTNTSLEDQGQ